jgi:Family of unknown function (DUF6502)
MPDSGPDLSTDARKQLLYAVRRVLRPIVRLLLRMGMPFDEFADVARGAYIEGAIREHPVGIRPTRDRIAFVAGLSRQQVDYYTDNSMALPVAGPTLGRLVTEVLHKWHTDPSYVGPYGIPLELEFDTPHGRSIQSLVAEIDPTASPGKALEELLRAGSVAYSGEKHYRAITRWVITPATLSPLSIEYFGEALTHLAQTIEYNFNLADTEGKRVERRVFADRGLPRKLLPPFETYARERANQFLSDIDDWIAHSVSTDSNEAGTKVDAGVNVFLYVEPASDEQPLSTLVQPPRTIGTSDDRRGRRK